MSFPETYYLDTYGCQMNFSDSELIEKILEDQGLSPARSEQEADLILLNTCGVRDHAEQRVLGRLRSMKKYKDRPGGKLIAVCGCMAQRMGTSLLDAAPWVDLLVGPDSYRKLPGLLREAAEGVGERAALEIDPCETYQEISPLRRNKISAWVPVARGCDNYCSYCVVPYVRGPERSISPEIVEAQVRECLAGGVAEIILLGQNVNSYRHGTTDFAALLRRLDRLDGRFWIRFLTSHPRDLGLDIIRAMAECGKVCEHLHLPFQSGSDRVLRAMNRGYTRAGYLGLVRTLRREIQGLGLTTDLLVGFPGETEEEFGETVSLLDEVRFDYAYTFKYSPRPGTAAARMEDSVPEQEKKRRLALVIEIQRGHTRAALDNYLGRRIEVLVCSPARTGEGMFVGRCRTHFNVLLPAHTSQAGNLVRAVVTGNTGMSLIAEQVR